MTVVATNSVKCFIPCSAREIRKAASVLEKQGMIEPLIINENSEISEFNPHHAAFYYAAQMLEWPTIIVCLESEAKNDH